MKHMFRKVLTLGLAAAMTAALLVGCGQKVDDIGGKIEETLKKFEGEIVVLWEDVKQEFTEIESKVTGEVEKLETVAREDVEVLVEKIKTGTEQIKEGVTEESHKVAQEVYEAAHKLGEYAKKAGADAEHELAKLAEDAKSLVKHYYGVAETDFQVVKTDVESGVKAVEAWSEEKWDEFLSLFEA